MNHPIYRVRSFTKIAPYTLRVRFDDETERIIDFQPILAGELYGPLRDAAVFNQVELDPEVQTLVWPNGADFDPATLHDWPQHLQALRAAAKQWEGMPEGTHLSASQGATKWQGIAETGEVSKT